MDPRSFVKVSVAALGLRIPVATKGATNRIHSSSSPCFCEVRLPNLPVQSAPVPLLTPESADPNPLNVAASFYLDEDAVAKLFTSSSCVRSSRPFLEVMIYTGGQGTSCGLSEGKLLGTLSIPVGAEWMEEMPVQVHNGWIDIGKDCGNKLVQSSTPRAQLHVLVKVEADPRYVFQFDGDIALSPQIVQGHGKTKQPIFSCKFSKDRTRSRFIQPDTPRSNSRTGLHTVVDHHTEKPRRERKGWVVMIHDLSGSPVAAASMVTPFVPFTGSDRVSRSNPGAWLILRPEHGALDNWRPWGRLEAWRERANGGLGLKFQLIAEGGGVAGMGSGVLISETVIKSKKGGEFSIDTSRLKAELSPPISPVETPHSSGDCSFNLSLPVVGGFVVNCSVQNEKKGARSVVQLATKFVSCVEDAAVFMALAAAVSLSSDACQSFSRKLRKELLDSDH